MPKYQITDNQTGRTVVVSGPKPPTPKDAEAIFTDAGLRQPAAQPAAKPTGDMVSNFLPSLGKNAAAMGQGLMSFATPLFDGQPSLVPPTKGARAIEDLLKGAVEKAIPGQQAEEPTFDATADFYKQRYGGVENVKRTVNEDPVGAIIDLSTLVSGGGTAVAKAGQLSKLGGVAKAGKVAQTAGAVLDPVNVALKTTGKVGQAISKAGGKAAAAMEQEAKNLPLQGVRITPPQQVAFKKRHKLTVQDFVRKEKLSGNPVELAGQKADDLQAQYDDLLFNSPETISKDEFVGAITKRIEALGKSRNFNDRKKIARLTEVKDFYTEMLGEGERLSLGEMVELRRGTDDYIRGPKAYADPNTADTNVMMRRLMNDLTYGKAPGGRDLGKKLERYYDFMELTEKTGAPSTKSRMGEFVKGAAATTALTNPSMIPAILAGYGVKRLAGNPTVLGGASAALEGGVKVSRAGAGAVSSKMSAMLRALNRTNEVARKTGLRGLPEPSRQ